MARPGPHHIHCVDPRTGVEAGDVACTPLADVVALATRARVAQRAWAAQSLPQRKKVVEAWKHAILARAGDVAALLVAEIGKPEAEAWSSEILTAGELFDGWLANIDDMLAPQPVDLNPVNYPGKEVVVSAQPRGLIGMIMPWNYPFHLPLRTMVPALLAGNAVIWKPSEHAARVGALLGEIAASVLPADLLVTVQGGAEQGVALIDAGVDRVVFTGSVATGRKVAQRAAGLGIEASLELGSKDAAIVLKDAPLDRTVHGLVWGAFHNAGQDCAAVERVYVERPIYEAFLQKVVETTKALRPGVDLGPLITREARSRVEGRIQEAVKAGATLHCGGVPWGEGFGLLPAVLSGVPEDATLMVEETFGPVMPILPFDREDEVVEKVNSSPFGLCASVWTKDHRRGLALLDRLDVGSTFLNNCCFTGPMAMAAWSGRRHSGAGVTGSKWSLDGLTMPHTRVIDRSGATKEMWWYPYTDAFTGMARGLVELGRRGGAKLQGIRLVLSGLLGRWK